MGLLIDNFAGGGGASYGLMAAFGRKVDIAINHDEKALAMHRANHPETRHLQEDVFAVDPAEVCAGQSIDAAWFSPDCTHFSRAKGGKPVKKKIRGLAWVVMRWAGLPKWQRPRVIFVENVEEFQTWGPLDADGFPIKARSGETFKRWVRKLERMGYVVEWRMLRAWWFDVPTMRNRFFLVARCDGEPIRWPAPTSYAPTAEGRRPPGIRATLTPRRTAAQCIDWTIPCPSIFTRKKSLAENTLRRVARGTMRYVVNNPRPFIVPLTHRGDDRVHDGNEPLRTITTAQRGEFMVVSPSIVSVAHGDSGGRREYPATDPLGAISAGGNAHAIIAPHLTKFHGGQVGQALEQPMPTVTANNFIKRPGGAPPLGVVSAFLAQYNTNPDGSVNAGHAMDEPVSTIVTRGPYQALTAAHLMSLKGSDRRDQSVELPCPAICAGGWHVAEVRAFLLKYYGTAEGSDIGDPMHTLTTLPRFGLVMVAGEAYQIIDIGMRMLTPRELFTAQGFAADYKIQVGWGPKLKPLTKSDQIRLVGNSVPPPVAVAVAVARANAPLMSRLPARGEKVMAYA